MAKFITLVLGTGVQITIPVNDIGHFSPAPDEKGPHTKTLVHCKGRIDRPWYVRETTEQILALIEGTDKP